MKEESSLHAEKGLQTTNLLGADLESSWRAKKHNKSKVLLLKGQKPK